MRGLRADAAETSVTGLGLEHEQHSRLSYQVIWKVS